MKKNREEALLDGVLKLAFEEEAAEYASGPEDILAIPAPLDYLWVRLESR